MPKKAKLTVAPSPPTLVAQLVINAYADRPPTLQCTGDLTVAMKLMAAGLSILATAEEQARKKAQPVEDRARTFLGPRDGNG